MDATAKHDAVIKNFRCLGADCPDSCCRGWDMPVDARQRGCYSKKAPELLATINEQQGIMKRSGSHQQCAQLCEGLCSIQARYGEEFLGDACYFYPRQLHRIGNDYRISGAISCPEMARLMLTQPAPFALQEAIVARVPLHRRDMVPAGWTPASVEAVMAHGMEVAGDTRQTPEAALDYLLRFAFALTNVEAGNWQKAAQLAMLAAAEPVHALPSDAHAIYYALALTEAFGEANISARLGEVMAAMAQQLDCQFDRAARTIQLGARASGAYAMLRARWQVDAQAALAPALRRWLQAQLAMTAFPFGGFADVSIAQRAGVLVQRFATVRLALMCHVSPAAVPPEEETVIRVMQGIARFMDHLADAHLTQMIHRDSGWESIARLRGLVAG